MFCPALVRACDFVPYPITHCSVLSVDMDLPSLASLSLGSGPTLRQRWLKACGVRPRFKAWKNLKGRDKHRMLHSIAMSSEDDTIGAQGQYLSTYTETDIDDIMASRLWSVEHVVPRSAVNGKAAGDAENDPLGWVEATRQANSMRSSYPLVLWELKHETGARANFVRLGGEQHFVPPLAQRARLARKWLFVRATYSHEHISPPSNAQLAHLQEIIALARDGVVGVAEQRAHDALVSLLGGGWRNPLMNHDSRKEFLNGPGFAALVS